MTQHRFRPRRYGYGATPVTWQGWVLIMATVVTTIVVSVALRPEIRSYWGLAAQFVVDAGALVALFIVGRRKTDGERHWRWGERN